MTKKKCCGNCVYGDDGVCGHPTDSAGEIGTDFLCEHYKKCQLCDMGGDAEHCEECVYYPDYKFDKETGECMRNKENK